MSLRSLRMPLLMLSLLLPALAAAQSGVDRDTERAQNATRVLAEIQLAPDRAIPHSLMQIAHAVAVIPNVIKAGLIFGGRFGEGLVSIKKPDGTWSDPAYIRLTGASFGFQAGVSSTDVILVFTNEDGVKRLIHGEFTIGADASAAAGPVGRYANASTNGHFDAAIYSYSRSRGLFAGVALDGARIGIDNAADQRVYGTNVTARRVFEGQVKQVPPAIVAFRNKLEEYTQ